MVLVKFNNKGMSLVELIITFSVFMVIIVGVYNLILDSKENLKDKEIIKNITDFSSYKNNEIHYDLIINKPFTLVLKEKKDGNFSCANDYCKLTKNAVTIRHNSKLKEVGLGLIDKDYCKAMYPCLVYFYDDKSEIGMTTIALNVDKESELGPGILYGKEKEVVFKKLPNSDEVTINTNSKDHEKKVYLAYRNNMLILNFPYYLDNKLNYGFKIVYPFEEVKTK